MIKNIQQLDADEKKILVRVDYNVPMTEDGQIRDDFRIVGSLPTLKSLLERRAAIVIMSHLKRPKGKPDPKLSLKPCALHLKKLLGLEVFFAEDCIGPKTLQLKQGLKPKQILLLENLRFHSEEQHTPSPQFAQELAQGMDGYVNDAFGCSHRKEASMFDVPQLFKGSRALGLLCEKELYYFQKYLLNAQQPITAIIGGAKISSKLGVLKSLLNRVDILIIGGAMANTFLTAQGYALEKSMIEPDFIESAKQILKECALRQIQVYLPKDLVFSDRVDVQGSMTVVQVGMTPPQGQQAVDIGPETIKTFQKVLKDAQVIFWNGPLGIFEVDAYARGTEQIARFLAQIRAIKIIGGGDSAAAINKLNLKNSFDHISTGGGASLELIEKGNLPAIEVLDDH